MTMLRPYRRHQTMSKALAATTPGVVAGTLATIGLTIGMMVNPDTLGKLPAIVAALVSLLQALATFLSVFRRDQQRHK